MEIIFFKKAEEQLHFFKTNNEEKVLIRIRLLLENIIATPYTGIGKPEPLKYGMQGLWS